MKKGETGPRRLNGEGSVWQEPGGRRRWVAQLPPDPSTGKRRRLFGKTQAEVLQRRKVELRKLEDFGGHAVKDPTLEVYLRQWLDLTAKPRIRASTLTSYRSKVETCIIPAIGKLRLSAIRPLNVRAMMAFVVEGKGGSRKGKRSARTANYCRVVLLTALEDARQDRLLLGENPAALTKPLPQPRKEMAVLASAELLKLLASLGTHSDRALLIFTASTGVRQGEALGLRWQDVDLEGPLPSVHLRVQLQTVEKVRQLVELKTAKSRRSLPLAPNLVALLKAHRVAQARRKLELGELWKNDLGLVFTDADGSPVSDNRVRRVLQKALKDAGIPRVRFHDLRHTAATLMLERNSGDIKALSDALGHSTIGITADTYVHARHAVLARTVGALDDLVPTTKAGTQ